MQERNRNKKKTMSDDNGRVCTDCGEYKTRDKFSRSYNKSCLTGYTPNCKECRNKRKREYRAKTNYAKDREYKKKRRKLDIGEVIMIIDNGTPEYYKVIKYQYKKGYMIQSMITRYYRRIDTHDNPNKVKFYKTAYTT